jgi:serine/threonine protein kinase
MVCRRWFDNDLCREALMWRSLNHEHVLPFLGIYEDDTASYLVSPYMKNGTLAQWRKKANPSIAEIEDRVWLFFLLLVAMLTLRKMLEVARGMEYIHWEGVVHGDLRGVFFLKHVC